MIKLKFKANLSQTTRSKHICIFLAVMSFSEGFILIYFTHNNNSNSISTVVVIKIKIIIIIMGELGRRITRITDDKRKSAFLFLSVLIQRYNAVVIQGTFAHTTPTSSRSNISFAFSFAFNPWDLCYRG